MYKITKGKEVPKEEFETIVATNTGATVALSYGHWPDWARTARSPNILSILFCPIYDGPKNRDTENIQLTGGRLTVLRYDPNDVMKGFPVNKDVYVYTCASSGTYIRYGPFNKTEKDHWMPFIFKDYKGWPEKK